MAGTLLTPKQVDELLDKLGNDDGFRADFQKDPDAAMRRIGASANIIWKECVRASRLASKEEIRRSRAIISESLLKLLEADIFCLEAK